MQLSAILNHHDSGGVENARLRLLEDGKRKRLPLRVDL